MTQSVLSALTGALTAACIPVTTGEPLAHHTTFGIGGPAALCAMPSSIEQLTAALDAWRAFGDGCPLCVLGRGSNVLVSDDGFDGLCVLTGGAAGMTFGDDGTVTAECGVPLTTLAAACARDGTALSGLEFAYGIPGSVGGAVAMNAGAFGGEMAEVVASAACYDLTSGRIFTIKAPDLGFSYRRSFLSGRTDLVLLSAVMRLAPGSVQSIRTVMDRNMAARREKQPLRWPSAGSVFKRPDADGVYVGRMVEDCGLKGYTVGGAQVSEKHAGFIINRGGATCADVLAVIDRVKAAVRERYGYDLVCEIRRIP